MQALITSGSQQFLVETGQTLQIDLAGDVKKLEFPALMVIDGSKVSVGSPHVAAIKVKAEVLEEVKGPKLRVLKFKAKKRVKRLTGHRQHYTRIKILSIG